MTYTKEKEWIDRIVKCFGTMDESETRRMFDNIRYHTKTRTLFTSLHQTIKECILQGDICVPLGELSPLLNATKYYHTAIHSALVSLAEEFRKEYSSGHIDIGDLQCVADLFNEHTFLFVCQHAGLPTVSGKILSAEESFCKMSDSDRLLWFSTLIDLACNGKAHGLVPAQVTNLNEVTATLSKNQFGMYLLSVASVKKSKARKALPEFSGSKAKRQVVVEDSALTEMSEQLGIEAYELRTFLADVDLNAALKEKIPELLGERTLSAVLEKLSPVWQQVFKAIFDIVTDKDMFKYVSNTEALKSAIQTVKSGADPLELLCWGEPDQNKRKLFVYANLFKENMVDPITFFTTVKESPALAQPKKFNSIDPEHMQKMFNCFLAELRKDSKLLQNAIDHSSRAAPFAAIEKALLPSLEVDVARLEMPALPEVKAFAFAGVFEEVAAVYPSIKPHSEKFVKTMEMWMEKGVFETTTRAELCKTLRSIFCPELDHVHDIDMTPVLLVIAELESQEIVNFAKST